MKYEVRDSATDKWETCTKAVVTIAGWLHYELRDGTNGLLRPGKYGTECRIKPSSRQRATSSKENERRSNAPEAQGVSRECHAVPVQSKTGQSQGGATMTRCQAYDRPLDGFQCTRSAVCCPLPGCSATGTLTDTCLEHMDTRVIDGREIKMCQECCYAFDNPGVQP